MANNPQSGMNRPQPRRQQPAGGETVSFNGNIDDLDAAIFGNGGDGGSALQEAFGGTSRANDKPYDAYADAERMAKGLPADLSNCKLPPAIIESIRRNPLILSNPETSATDAFANSLADRLPGLKAAQDIIADYERKDEDSRVSAAASQMMEQKNNAGGGINYEILKLIIENAVDKSVEKHLKSLTEGVNRAGSPASELSVMKIGKKFLFLGSDDNVWEASLRLVGKNKPRK